MTKSLTSKRKSEASSFDVLFATVLVLVLVIGGIYIHRSHENTKPLQQLDSNIFHDVWLVPDDEADKVGIYLIFTRGEMDNQFEEGLAHYVEHLAWLNAYEGEQSSRHSNAWTDSHVTGYWQSTTGENFDETLRRLLRVSDSLQLETDFMLEERKIVQREYELRISESPLHPVHQSMHAIMYEDGPLARSIIGSPEDIKRFSLDDARTLHAESHLLENARLFVTGNITAFKLEGALAKFQTTKGAAGPITQTFNSAAFRDERSVIIPEFTGEILIYRKLVRLDNCGVPLHCNLSIELIKSTLNSTLPGGLSGPISYDEFIAANFSVAFNRPDEKHLEMTFTASPDRGVEIDTVLAVFEEELNNILTEGLPSKTFQNRKDVLIENVMSGRNNPAYLANLVLNLISLDWPVYSWDDEIRAARELSEENITAIMTQLSLPGRVVIRKVLSEDE